MKQAIIIRQDIKMKLGKAVAQGAHASMGAILPAMEDQRVKDWLAGSFTKIALKIDTLEELLELEKKAKEAGFLTCLIEDNGRTVFHGQKTVTCLAIGPDTHERMKEITGHLKLVGN